MAFFDSELTTEGDDSVGGILQEFGNFLQANLVQSLFDKGAVDSAQLSQSIVFDIDFTGSVWRFELKMEDYGKFIDQGVQGAGKDPESKSSKVFPNVAPASPFSFKQNRKPSVNHFRKWSNNRGGLNPFAIRESVFRKGLKPNYFYSDIVDENLINNLVNLLEQKGAIALEREIATSITGELT